MKGSMKAKISEDGRAIMPPGMHRELSFEVGDALTITAVENEIRILSYVEAVRRARTG